MDHPPVRLGRYEIVKRIGRGGMGTVYLARDPRLNRTVALKVLADFSTSEFRERFAREARAAAALRHHHIVTVYDIGEEDDLPFIAMEYVEGETLAAFIGRKPPTPADRKLQIATELCTGLLHAHRVGIVHRDVKPGNVMLGDDGTVKILDFGLARWVAEVSSAGLTQAGTLMGSPHYMSPEQISGQTVDQRSDIFSVGVVLYELLTYQKAYPGDSTINVIHRILFTDPASVRAMCPDVEPELEAIVGKALQRAPENRYQTLQEMLQDLARVRARLSARDDVAVWQPVDASSEVGGSTVGSANPPSPDLIALEERQVAAWLFEAKDHVSRGELTRAEALIAQCLMARPESADALALQRTLLARRGDRVEPAAHQSDAPSEKPKTLDNAGNIERTRLLPPEIPVDNEADRESPTPNRPTRRLTLAGIAVAATLALVWISPLNPWNSPDLVENNRPPAVTTEQILAEADSMLNNGRTAEAIDRVNKVIAAEPNHPAAMALLARIRDDEARRANEARDKATEGTSVNPAQLVERARAAYKEGRLRPAIDLALAALKLEGANKEASAFLAQVRDDARKPTVGEREAAIRSGAQSTSADFVAAANAEKLAEQTRDPAETARAVEHYRVAREQYQAAGRTAESLAKTAAARAADTAGLLAQVDAFIEARNFDAATQLLDKAQSRDPLNPRVPQARERIRSAEQSWRARQEEQEKRDTQTLLARVEAIPDLQQRENALMDAQAKYPKSTDIRAALARTREEMRRPPTVAQPSRSVDRREILQTVRSYADAYATLSDNAVLAIYPNAPSRRQEAMDRQKKACRKLQVTFDEGRIQHSVMADGRVVVDVPLQYRLRSTDGGQTPPAGHDDRTDDAQ